MNIDSISTYATDMKTSMPFANKHRLIGMLIFYGSLMGCSTTPTTEANNDPWEGWNRDVSEFNDDFDETILKPLAKGYDDAVPNPVDESITNIFSNINDIGVTINDFLQFKFKQGGMDASRFLINTTAGLAGAFDVAKELDLPKHDEDFGQTLGYWGVPNGNYMVLPFIGASSPREAIGLLGDALFNPLTYVSFFGGFAANIATASATAVDVTDTRSDLMQSEKILNEASVDRYDFIKNSYLQRREYLVYDGKPPEDTNDPLADDVSGDNGSTGSGGPAASSSQLPQTQSNTVVKPVPNPFNGNGANGAEIIDNSTKMPVEDKTNVAPVIDNSRHFLDLTAPDE